MLDFSRTFPPVFKAPDERPEYDRLWPFYCLFRAEFLIRYKVFSLLSPDSYSNFQSPLHPEEKAQVCFYLVFVLLCVSCFCLQNHADIRQATEFLKTHVVHSVCVALSQEEATTRSLSHTFHREGFSCCFFYDC